MDVVGADPLDDPVGLEYREHLRLDARQAQGHAVGSASSWSSLSFAEPWESTKLTPSSRARARAGGLVLGSSRTRSSSASAVAKNRPPSMRRTATPGNVSSPGFSSRSRKTWVPGSRPSSGIGGRVAT